MVRRVMSDEQARRYRVLRKYGLTVAQARDAVGLVDEVPVPAAAAAAAVVPPERSLLVVDDFGEVPASAWEMPLVPAPTRAVVGYEDAPRWRSICERVADPVVALRRGGGGPVR